MKALFTFHIDTETGEATIAGNITVQQALQIIQQLAISQAVQEATSNNGNKEVANATAGLPQQSTD